MGKGQQFTSTEGKTPAQVLKENIKKGEELVAEYKKFCEDMK